MATGGAPDDTFVCSVCLEPYTSRSPRLSPCFHRFDLPSLVDLEKHHTGAYCLRQSRDMGEIRKNAGEQLANITMTEQTRLQLRQVSSDKKVCKEEDGDKKSTLTFHCATGRTFITVPPGGVAQFQTNFYVNHESLTCDVCDKGQDAMYSCADCNQNMCSQCQRCHDKLTANHEVQALSTRCQEPPQNSLDPDWERRHNEQVKVLEAALDQMREEEETLQTQTQAVADAISRRADSERALVSQTEKRGQRALAEVADMLSKQVHEEMVTARGHHSRLWQGGATSQGGDVRTTLLADENFQYYQQRNSKGRQPTQLLHQFDDSAVSMQAVEAYIGTVGKNTQPSEVASSVSEIFLDWDEAELMDISFEEAKLTETAKDDVSAASPQSDVVQLEHEMTDMKRKLKELEELVDSWGRNSTDVADSVRKQNEIFEVLKEKLFALEEDKLKSDEVNKTLIENMGSLKQDMTSIQHELSSVSRVNSKVQMDIQTIQQNVERQVSNLSHDLATLKGKCNTRVAFYASLSQDECFRKRSRMVLDDVATNVGEAYNPLDGIFTAPVSGTYLFLATALRCEGRGRASLMICSDSLRSGHSRSHNGNDEMGVNCVSYLACDLSAGEEVWVEAWSNMDLESEFTSFSGLLVQPNL